MKVHLIAVGGAVMHNLAIALRKKGYEVTGSDDEIFDPARSNLKKWNLLPSENGWFPEKIDATLDVVVVGMHAKHDNPELLKAVDLGIETVSFPEYAYRQTENKQRVVIGGSHGKTTVTSMIMHVLKKLDASFDYLVGAALPDFNEMVKFSDKAQIAIFEGDEYLASTLRPQPKFHFYKPHIAVLTGVAWDHINVFPTFENYLEQFRLFVETIEPGGSLIYYEKDEHLAEIIANCHREIDILHYDMPEYSVVEGGTVVHVGCIKFNLKIFGKHNMQNLEAARLVCSQLEIDEVEFYESVMDFTGAARRLELLAENSTSAVYQDFAHAPSKLQATIAAIKEQYPQRRLKACIELHTFSSLNKDFLPLYAGTLDQANEAIVFINHHTLTLKRMDKISERHVHEAFQNKTLKVIFDSKELEMELKRGDYENTNLLLMSSGDFGGLPLREIAKFAAPF